MREANVRTEASAARAMSRLTSMDTDPEDGSIANHVAKPGRDLFSSCFSRAGIRDGSIRHGRDQLPDGLRCQSAELPGDQAGFDRTELFVCAAFAAFENEVGRGQVPPDDSPPGGA